mgnify:CR=1 FL=1|tara:strand:+ start:39 stop:275 length:237 start_codon:yes stop_codon:yes gene_type:complete
MEEVTPTQEATKSVNVELDAPGMQEEVSITLTRAQLTIINEFLKEHIQPKGYEMISFAYDLFSRLHEALETEESEGAF